MSKQTKTSWENSSTWYDETVGKKGHYYHETVILPKLFALMDLHSGDQVLDLGCGQGILARHLPKKVNYTGIDVSTSLIHAAKTHSKQKDHRFLIGDVTKKLPISNQDFSHTVFLLSLQNIETPLGALINAFKHLDKQGTLYLVMNHPCFRIPRHSHWGIDESKKLQFRRLDCYLTPQKIPIQMHPGKNKQKHTWSFHYPLSTYVSWLIEAGFVVVDLQEWVSEKKSVGKKARMENRARQEFPLFITFVCQKSGAI